jgi:hypothetical protein
VPSLAVWLATFAVIIASGVTGCGSGLGPPSPASTLTRLTGALGAIGLVCAPPQAGQPAGIEQTACGGKLNGVAVEAVADVATRGVTQIMLIADRQGGDPVATLALKSLAATVGAAIDPDVARLAPKLDGWTGPETPLEAGDVTALAEETQSSLVLAIVPVSGSFGH